VRLLADARIVARIAEAAGSRLGFFRLDCAPDRVAEITLVVAPEFRRCGLGRRLLLAALRTAQHAGIGQVVALVDADNRRALAFFDAGGFSAEGMVGTRHRLVKWLHGRAGRPLEVEV
jgi:ribosomal protein S18 acetylase RimI-like enzyme